MTLVEKMCVSNSEEEYLKHVEELQAKFPEISAYFINNWHSCRQHWAGYHLSQYDTYGHITNNMIESNHARIKKYVDKNTSVPDLLRQLVKLSSEEKSKRKIVQSKLRLKKAVINDRYSNLKPVFEEISSFVTPVVANLL